MDIETIVAGYYAHGHLETAILAGLAAAGKDPAHLAVDDLAPVDEFHIGGRRATEELAAELFVRMRAAAQGGPPPLGLHLVMGEATRAKVANMIGDVERGLIAPTQLIARAV
jgi:hypothetical protein